MRDHAADLEDARRAAQPARPEGLRILFGTFGKIEQTWTIEDVIAEGNKVVVRASNRCLQESFFGIPTKGRWQTFSSTFTFRVEHGQVQEIWRNADDLGRVLQLGARLGLFAGPHTKHSSQRYVVVVACRCCPQG